MFVIREIDIFEWPLKIKLPDGGQMVDHTLELKLKRLSIPELETMAKNPEFSQLFLCRQVIIGWKNVVDEKNQPVEFNAENLDKVLLKAGIGPQIYDQYMLIGSEVSAKN